MCFYDDGDKPTFSTHKVVKARKSHECSVCWGAIGPGQQYECYTWGFDGTVQRDKICRRCCHDIVRIVEHELAEGCRWAESWPSFGEVLDYLSESGLGQTRPEEVPATFQVGDLPKEPVRSEQYRPSPALR